MRFVSLVSAFLFTIVLAGCGQGTPADGSAKTAPSGDAAWLLATAPANAVPVQSARKTAREGEEVVVRGRIGGRADPMSTEAAVFVLMDTKLPHCTDGCAKPWDYCCETPETITAHSATVQLVGAAGGPMALDLASYGFRPLDEVVVVGKVAPRPSDAVLIIRAEKIHRVAG